MLAARLLGDPLRPAGAERRARLGQPAGGALGAAGLPGLRRGGAAGSPPARRWPRATRCGRPSPRSRRPATRGRRDGPFRVLVFGGSRGAHTLNAAVRPRRPRPGAGRDDLALLIADRRGRPGGGARGLGRHPTRSGCAWSPTWRTWPAALAWADLAVCRAGAMTLAELQAAGRPAVLVPFPFATDDHQRRNAEACAAAGAAVVLADADCDGPALTAAVDALRSEPARLAAMGAAARGRWPGPTRRAVIARGPAEPGRASGGPAGRAGPSSRPDRAGRTTILRTETTPCSATRDTSTWWPSAASA